MYPNLYFALEDLFGWNLPALKLINSFGFFVALAFLVAHVLLRKELSRMGQHGWFPTGKRTDWVGLPPSPLDLAIQALMGFFLGWKVLPGHPRRHVVSGRWSPSGSLIQY